MSNEKEEVKGTGHIYDGIEELDHPSPQWFMNLFYVTISFGVVYFLHYTVGEGPTLTEEYQRSKLAAEVAQLERAARTGSAKLASEDDLKALLRDPAQKSIGAAAFQSKCSTCHGTQGQGGIGPNLTDSYWLHGGKLTEVLATISRGVPDKGMPPWGPLLKEGEAKALTVFIRTLSGTNPAGAKGPQGSLVKTEL